MMSSAELQALKMPATRDARDTSCPRSTGECLLALKAAEAKIKNESHFAIGAFFCGLSLTGGKLQGVGMLPDRDTMKKKLLNNIRKLTALYNEKDLDAVRSAAVLKGRCMGKSAQGRDNILTKASI